MKFAWLNEVSGSYQYVLENLPWLQEVAGVYLG